MYERFSELLQENGVTAYKVSKATGVPQSTLSDWKRGVSYPKYDKLQKIAEYFGVSVKYLKGETDIREDFENNPDYYVPAQYREMGMDAEAYYRFKQAEAEDAQRESSLPAGAIPYVPGPMVLIPLVGSVNCGTPLFADENIEEYIPTRKSEMLSGEKYFYLKAKGDSMINAGIQDGDLLFIRKQSDVNSGDIAVVTINGDEATLKRVIKKENALVLQPENPSYETKIYVGSEVNNICIKGRLMKVEKTF